MYIYIIYIPICLCICLCLRIFWGCPRSVAPLRVFAFMVADDEPAAVLAQARRVPRGVHPLRRPHRGYVSTKYQRNEGKLHWRLLRHVIVHRASSRATLDVAFNVTNTPQDATCGLAILPPVRSTGCRSCQKPLAVTKPIQPFRSKRTPSLPSGHNGHSAQPTGPRWYPLA